MGTVITNLKARFGVDSTDFKKGLKDGEKAVDDFKDSAGSSLDKFASMFGVNMGAVNDAMGTATKSLNFLGQSITAMGTGANKAAVAFKILKSALVASGIGALVVALGSVAAYFQKSGEGADKFAKILAQVKSVVNNVIDRLAIFGKGVYEIATGKFKQGWETMKTAFKDAGTELKEDWKLAGQLADAEDALEDREIALINSLEERRAKVAELRLLAKEETEDQKKKLSILQQAEGIIKSVYSDEISLAREGLRILKEKIALASDDPTDEQRREIAEAEAEINSLLRKQSEELKSITREKGAALKLVQEEVKLETAKAGQIAIVKASLENIKMPDFAKVFEGIQEPIKAASEALKDLENLGKDIDTALEQAFESMAVGVGEFLGNLLLGEAGAEDFGKMMIGAFADLAISVGKVAISSAIAVGAISKMLTNPANWPLALAAGVALVAIGTAVKGALSSAASGGGSSGSSGSLSSASYTYNTNAQANAQPIKIELSGKLIGEGSQLVAVIDNEGKRKYKNT